MRCVVTIASPAVIIQNREQCPSSGGMGTREGGLRRVAAETSPLKGYAETGAARSGGRSDCREISEAKIPPLSAVPILPEDPEFRRRLRCLRMRKLALRAALRIGNDRSGKRRSLPEE